MSTVEFNIFRGSESGNVVPDTVRRTIQPTGVFVEITHAGLCGTDRLYKNKPIALGHEGVGIVRGVGSAVESFKTGDKVGFGWVQKVCGKCDYCITDKDQYCEQREPYGTDAFKIGSFATHAVWDESMLVKLPDILESQFAAPLMCGGAAVWDALTSYDLRPGDRVGIQGVGGIGHMAVQFASALGYDVVAFGSKSDKSEVMTGLGAKEFHVLEEGVSKTAVKPVQHLLWCGSGAPDFARIFPLVAHSGTIHLLTVSSETPPLPIQALVSNGIRIQGSSGASQLAVRKMLRFVSLKGIRPIVMSWPMTKGGIEAAYQMMEEGRMRYRGVIVSERHLTGKSAVERM
ncbi:hypothetical protein ASPWEDRAFT_58172 [Aspergillus wentii DTO 134E9]|uniref:Enoyl reductase (ER) domain-containing protein n=1 Tax=Aspergillus wentii DTO 134E9 TaxID=1073089 RepID=A0A1L9RYC7_ASPWE|nr:uncharacterized protein ASPWEDRAFT_58172 [Aspergillus wentii DTO 134E9]KAI9931427.1 hypothetical protein MW887_010002 [Aspergillus wentii]OJJ39903.1 hypothetical protein ASPWEDRAFT_58172 [Aspergillus wentii DTO 134E9]